MNLIPNPKKIQTFARHHAELRGGSGGSHNLIYVGDSHAYKIVPFYYKRSIHVKRPNHDQKEILFYKKLTNEFIRTGKTPHIVYHHGQYTTQLSPILKKNIKIEDLYFTKHTKFQFELVNMQFELKNGQLKDTADVIIMEKCPLTISKYIEKHLKLNIIPTILNRIIFQVIFTLAVLQDKYPSIVHNDLFLRNVLAREETKYDKNDVVEYNFGKYKFYLPANGIYVKLNDFGDLLDGKSFMTTKAHNVNERLVRPPSINCKKCDLFNFLHDLYDGKNMGGTSCMTIAKTKKMKLTMRDTIKKYIDVSTIDKINKHSKNLLDITWSVYNIPMLRKLLKEPAEYMPVMSRLHKFQKNMNIIKRYNKN